MAAVFKTAGVNKLIAAYNNVVCTTLYKDLKINPVLSVWSATLPIVRIRERQNEAQTKL